MGIEIEGNSMKKVGVRKMPLHLANERYLPCRLRKCDP